MSQTVEVEDVATGTSCATCARHAAGTGSSPSCQRDQLDGDELAYVLDVSRLWVWRSEKRRLFKRSNTAVYPSFCWEAVRDGIVKYDGGKWRMKLVAAEKRFKEVLSGRVVRKPVEKTRTKKAKAKR